MNKNEYEKINKLLDEGKIDELRDYLDERIGIRKYSASIKAIMELIETDCYRKYPSYYERTQLHKGSFKVYRGFYSKLENGFVICHKDSNIFRLYDDKILTPEMKKILETSIEDKNSLDIQKKEGVILDVLSNASLTSKLVLSTSKEGNVTTSYTLNKEIALPVPTGYYNAAHKILGKDTKEYIDGNKGLYLSSPIGQAYLMRLK